jgi:hypothetical protein
MKRILSIAVLLPFLATAQVTLQPWTQVYGTVNGQQLGSEVQGINATTNLPYKASIKSFGSTGLYTLQMQSDTGAHRIFLGSNMQTGDLNSDGLKDVVVRIGNTITIYWGTAASIDTVNPLRFSGVGDFGRSICIANIIGDGTVDLIIGAPNFPTASVSQGRVSVYRGGAIFDTIPAITINGDSTRYYLGVSCTVGDLNNDGFNDLAVRGWYQVGATSQRFDYVDVWFGGAAFDTTRDIRLRSASIVNSGLACFDANGDGIDDLLWTNADSAAWINIHYGGVSFSSNPSLRLRDPQLAEFGTSIVNAGDMNGDGYNDILIGAYFSNNPGYVYVYGGGPRIDQYFDAAVGMSSLSYFGYSVSSVGDITGDGLADIIVGAPNFEFGNQRGYWGIFKGDSSIRVTDVRELQPLPSVIVLHAAFPNPFNPQTTIRYDLHTTANIHLEIFDLIGRHVVTLATGAKSPGSYAAVFDGSGLPSGMYFYRLTATTADGRTWSDTKKLTLVK